MHLLIYRERPDVKAVCHAHPPHGTALRGGGIGNRSTNSFGSDPDARLCPLAEYGTPSTQELTDAMRPLVKHHNALLMAESWRSRLRR
jgi:L-fuculose-phosphate aldolase